MWFPGHSSSNNLHLWVSRHYLRPVPLSPLFTHFEGFSVLLLWETEKWRKLSEWRVMCAVKFCALWNVALHWLQVKLLGTCSVEKKKCNPCHPSNTQNKTIMNVWFKSCTRLFLKTIGWFIKKLIALSLRHHFHQVPCQYTWTDMFLHIFRSSVLSISPASDFLLHRWL